MSIQIPFVDLKKQYYLLREEIKAAIDRVLENSQFILGPEVKDFERKIASWCGVRYAVGVGSGTDAIKIALLASSVSPGDEVITTPFTFVATLETIVDIGAVPILADIEPDTYNISPEAIEQAITPRTKAVLPVHLYGHAVDMDPVMKLARNHGLKVIEDCAQALGSSYDGQKVGGIGDAGCLSFFPSKNLGGYGDGGMVITNDGGIAERAAMLRNHGAVKSYHYDTTGFNSRLDAMQAAVLDVKLRHLDEWIASRRKIAGHYKSLLQDIDGIVTPYEAAYGTHSFNYYTIRMEPTIDRDSLRQHLNSLGIATMIYYPLCLHLQKAYQYLGYRKGDFPESERAQGQVLSLPMYPEIPADHVTEIVSGIKQYVYENNRRRRQKQTGASVLDGGS